MTTHFHEVSFGVKHAGAYGLVPVAEGDHVEDDRLGYGQDERHQPNGHDLDDGEQGDAHPLHPAPGRHGPVPVAQEDERRSTSRRVTG